MVNREKYRWILGTKGVRDVPDEYVDYVGRRIRIFKWTVGPLAIGLIVLGIILLVRGW